MRAGAWPYRVAHPRAGHAFSPYQAAWTPTSGQLFHHPITQLFTRMAYDRRTELTFQNVRLTVTGPRPSLYHFLDFSALSFCFRIRQPSCSYWHSKLVQQGPRYTLTQYIPTPRHSHGGCWGLSLQAALQELSLHSWAVEGRRLRS